MDEDEELYREMNEEDPYYMGSTDENEDFEKSSTNISDERPAPQYEFKPIKWWKVVLGCLAWIIAIASVVFACSI